MFLFISVYNFVRKVINCTFKSSMILLFLHWQRRNRFQYFPKRIELFTKPPCPPQEVDMRRHSVVVCVYIRGTPVFCALINGEGEVVDFLRLPYFMTRRNAFREDEREKKVPVFLLS